MMHIGKPTVGNSGDRPCLEISQRHVNLIDGAEPLD